MELIISRLLLLFLLLLLLVLILILLLVLFRLFDARWWVASRKHTPTS